MSVVSTTSAFRAAPRLGHLERIKRIYEYLDKIDQAKLRVRTDEPDISSLPNHEYDWSRTVYGDQNDAPTTLGKHDMLLHIFDANLMHDLMTGRSMTGILHSMMNETPIDGFSKKQATVDYDLWK
jgi:hypothetical protein